MDWKLWMVMGVVVCACDVRTETLEAETGDPVSDCDYPGDRTAATFEALTANVWNGPGCDYAGDELPPPCDNDSIGTLEAREREEVRGFASVGLGADMGRVSAHDDSENLARPAVHTDLVASFDELDHLCSGGSPPIGPRRFPPTERP